MQNKIYPFLALKITAVMVMAALPQLAMADAAEKNTTQEKSQAGTGVEAETLPEVSVQQKRVRALSCGEPDTPIPAAKPIRRCAMCQLVYL